jgi:hypothetical protein
MASTMVGPGLGTKPQAKHPAATQKFHGTFSGFTLKAIAPKPHPNTRSGQ